MYHSRHRPTHAYDEPHWPAVRGRGSALSVARADEIASTTVSTGQPLAPCCALETRLRLRGMAVTSLLGNPDCCAVGRSCNSGQLSRELWRGLLATPCRAMCYASSEAAHCLWWWYSIAAPVELPPTHWQLPFTLQSPSSNFNKQLAGDGRVSMHRRDTASLRFPM